MTIDWPWELVPDGIHLHVGQQFRRVVPGQRVALLPTIGFLDIFLFVLQSLQNFEKIQKVEKEPSHFSRSDCVAAGIDPPDITTPKNCYGLWRHRYQSQWNGFGTDLQGSSVERRRKSMGPLTWDFLFHWSKPQEGQKKREKNVLRAAWEAKLIGERDRIWRRYDAVRSSGKKRLAAER